jgi:uncharacterized protein YqjF (DUF2071 family)
MTEPVTLTDRLESRKRPEGMPLMRQSWDKLLFMHWEIEPSLLRGIVPQPLAIDTFEGNAYLAITPFTLWNVRPIFLPPIPLVSAFHETNVRTYVHYDGVPGVWFFSLDANGLLAVLAARLGFHLPYYYASIKMDDSDGRIRYDLIRSSERRARLAAEWTMDELSETSTPGSLRFFLTERYCLYTRHGADLYRARIHHEPWPIHEARLDSLDTNLFEANELPHPAGDPFVMGGGPVHVDVWPLERVGTAARADAYEPGLGTTAVQACL